MQTETQLNNVGANAFTTWYAVYTRHQHEKAVAQGLAGKQFDVFLPVYTSVRQWKDRLVRLALPLFPGYVFLRGDMDRRLDIVSSPSVHYLLSLGGRPAVIPEAEIEAVRRVVESRFQVEPCPFLRCGDRVRVKSGALAGIEGIVVRRKHFSRLVLSVELLEKSVAVEVGGLTVERLPDSSDTVNRSWPMPALSIAQGQPNPSARY